MKLRLGLLASLHIVAGLVIGLCTSLPATDFLEALFVALVFADSGLLGIGGALSADSLSARVGGVVVGLLYFGIVSLMVVPNDAGDFFFVILITFGTVSGVMHFVRFRGARLQDIRKLQRMPNSEGLRFTILHLLGLTTLIAVFLAMFQWLRHLGEQSTLAIVIIFALTLVVAPLVAVWATLGLGRALVRVPIALCLSLLPGLLPVFYFNDQSPEFYWLWPTTTYVQGVITIGSLLVVRSGGYRLVGDSARPEHEFPSPLVKISVD